MIGYKLVQDFHGELQSYLGTTLGDACVRYGLNHKTTRAPKCGPLAIFNNLKNATTFLRKDRMRKDVRIFRCRAKVSHAKQLWDSRNRTLKHELPNGTILVDTVTLLEEVKL